MKKKEIQDLKTKPEAELQKLLKEWRERLRVLKFDLAAGKVKDISEIHEVRKNISRALTFLRQTGHNANSANNVANTAN